MTNLPVPVELTDAELEVVSAGQANGNLGAAGIGAGLVNVAVGLGSVSVLDNAHTSVAVGVLSGIVGARS
jgi:hypothetical protein